MAESCRDEITELLKAWSQGDEAALEKVTPIVYQELHRLAHRYMVGEREGHTLQTTALVNEVYLRLVDCARVSWQDRAHFFAICAKLMRRILVDHARSRQRVKRGAGMRPISLEEAQIVSHEPDPNILDLDQALTDLAHLDPRKSQVIELRFFGGLSVKETAEVLKVSAWAVKRDWGLARAWIYRELSEKTVP